MDASEIPLYERIYYVVSLIPQGKVATYGQIARIVGTCTARMVGYAMSSLQPGRNVPWQRVINSKGMISFPPGSPGAALQRALLEEEGVIFDDKGRVNLRVYGWQGLDPVQIAAGDFEQADSQEPQPEEPRQPRLF